MKMNEKQQERFHTRYTVNEETGCWEWQGHRLPKGYGFFHVNDDNYLAHRVSYHNFVGPIKEGNCVCHSCDNPCCVNPEHLWQGSYTDNLQDMARKGRQHCTVLSWAEVQHIRVLHRMSMPMLQISKLFGVSKTHIRNIIIGKKWSHI